MMRRRGRCRKGGRREEDREGRRRERGDLMRQDNAKLILTISTLRISCLFGVRLQMVLLHFFILAKEPNQVLRSYLPSTKKRTNDCSSLEAGLPGGAQVPKVFNSQAPCSQPCLADLLAMPSQTCRHALCKFVRNSCKLPARCR